mgnify:CR=1 FL=1
MLVLPLLILHNSKRNLTYNEIYYFCIILSQLKIIICIYFDRQRIILALLTITHIYIAFYPLSKNPVRTKQGQTVHRSEIIDKQGKDEQTKIQTENIY